VCVFPRVNWINLARCSIRLLFAGTLPESLVIRLQTRSFMIIGKPSVCFEVDGELATPLPAKFTVRQAALRVLVP